MKYTYSGTLIKALPIILIYRLGSFSVWLDLMLFQQYFRYITTTIYPNQVPG